ncbi:MAG: hypothetical protein SPF56_08435 [Bacteroidaceae bacterium]|nr:hypothetical protein [Bacteroidaceae bacterium]
MRTLSFLALSVFLFAGAPLSDMGGKEPTVYICTGPKAAVYHKTMRCSGLNRCSGDVVPLSLSKAKEMGRRACKKCY